MNTTDGTPLLRAWGLRKEYGRAAGLVRAVDGVDLEVAVGETVAVMGPSGCGKSTLLYLLGGLDQPTGGEVWLAGTWASSPNGAWPGCAGTRSGSCSRPST